MLHLHYKSIQNKMETNKTITFRPSKKNETILAQLSKLAEKENRSLNNYIETIFLSWLKTNPVNKTK